MLQSTKRNVTNEVLEEFLLLPLFFIVVQYKISCLHLWVIPFVDLIVCDTSCNSDLNWLEVHCVPEFCCLQDLVKCFTDVQKNWKNMGQDWECSFFITLFQILKFKPVAISKFPNGWRWALQGIFKKPMHPRHKQWHWDVSAFLSRFFKQFLMFRLAVLWICLFMHLLRFSDPFFSDVFPLIAGENPTAMVICDQGMIWHTGQEGPSAQAFKLDGSKDARDRTLLGTEICRGDKKCCSIAL